MSVQSGPKKLEWQNKRKSEFKPHYEAKFTPEQLGRFDAQDFPNVDSRSIRAMIAKSGIEMEVTGPANQGLVILAFKDGWYERTMDAQYDLEINWGDDNHSHIIHYKKSDREILSMNVPTGISKLAFVFKMQPDHNKPGEPPKMYAF